MSDPALPAPQGSDACRHELRFDSAYRPGRGMSFPCDEAGRVDPQSWPESLRRAYATARAGVGREYMYPAVRPVH